MHPGDDGPPSLRPSDEAVGRWVTNGSCVPVAPNYVLTTDHQDYGTGWPVVIGGVAYTTAEIFTHSLSDLRVVRIETPGGAPADLSYYTPVYTGTGEVGETAVLGSYGKGRGNVLTTTTGKEYGYTWLAEPNTTLRWGANRIDGADTAEFDYTIEILLADFDAANAPTAYKHVAHEASPADFDSGGGWFVDVSAGGTGDWRLVGLSRGAEHGYLQQTWFRNEGTGTPDPDQIEAVRVSSYAPWINAILDPSRWNVDASGTWAAAVNWSPAVPDHADVWAVLGDVISDDRTVTLDSAVTLGTLRFDSGHGYTIAGDGSLVFSTATSTAGIEVNRQGLGAYHGAHTVDVPVTLLEDLVLNTESHGEFILAGAVSGDKRLTKRGTGTAVLAAANTFSGGLTVNAGTLRVTAADGMGTGDVTLAPPNGPIVLDLRHDSPVSFPNAVVVTGNVTVNVGPADSGQGHTIGLASLTIAGDRTFTVTGTDGYALAVAGATHLALVTGTATLNTAGADLILSGELDLLSGTLAKTGPNTLTIGGPQAYGFETVLNVEDGAVVLNTDAGSSESADLTVNVTGASAFFGATQHLAALTLSGAASQVTGSAKGVLVVGQLGIDPADSVLDLNAGGLVADYDPEGPSPLADVTGWLALGQNIPAGGYWDGLGIRSSAAASDPTGLTTLGVLDNAEYGYTEFPAPVPGDPPIEVDPSSVLVRYTCYGDADLSGEPTGDDYFLWLAGFDAARAALAHGGEPALSGWLYGDFDYSGDITGDDYFLWLVAFDVARAGGIPLSGQGGPDPLAPTEFTDDVADLVATYRPGGVTVLPEPGTLLLVAAGLLHLVRRRRV